MDARRRRPSNSASTSQSHEDPVSARAGGLRERSVSSHSATPLDDDDDKPKRSTRGRNPLPPTCGPLFPPLPPKQPRASPNAAAASSSTPSTSDKRPRIKLLHSADSIGAAAGALDEVETSHDAAAQLDAPFTSHDVQADGVEQDMKPTLPGDNADVVAEAPVETANEAEEAKSAEELATTKADDLPDEETATTPKPQPSISGATTLSSPPPTSDLAENMDVDEPSEDVEAPDDLMEVDEPTPRKNGTKQDDVVEEEDSVPPESSTAKARAAARRRRGEEQLLFDDHLLPAEMRQHGALSSKRRETAKEDEEEDAKNEAEETVEVANEGEEDEERDDVTRCVCHSEDTDSMMIQCDNCNVWQHGPCMGIWTDDEAPDEYYCEECRPDLHAPLRKWIRTQGRGNVNYIPPQPADLLKYHHYSHKHPPSQSNRWPDPEPEPAKPAPRSHHRKDPTGSPIDSVEGSRNTRGRQPTGGSVKDVKPASSKPAVTTGRRKSDAPVSGRRIVTSPSPPASPAPDADAAPKKRRTQNSRDAEYQDYLNALAASKSESEKEQEKKADDEEEDKGGARKGKRKRDDEESGSVEPSGTPTVMVNGKTKHPNQYTYRPKPPSSNQAVASPARRNAGTPVPSLPPPAQHEHGTRRAGAIANGIIPPPPNSISVHNLHWYLPEHLSAFSDLLPTPVPTALESRAPRQMPYLSRNHFLNQKYGPFSEERDEKGKLRLPEDQPGREPTGEPVTKLEPPVRVRYPVRRITTAEIRKRVRNVLEFVSRVQTEEAKRKDRASLIGLDKVVLPLAKRLDKDGDEIEEGSDHANRQSTRTTAEGRTSADLMDELMRDLISFQETFHVGGFATPIPPSVSAFPDSAPVTPALPSAATMVSTATDVLTEANMPEIDTHGDEPVDTPVDQSVEPTADLRLADPVVEDVPSAQPERTEDEDKIMYDEPATIDDDADNQVHDAPAPDQTVEELVVPESVEVYREGEVSEVITQPEEIGVS